MLSDEERERARLAIERYGNRGRGEIEATKADLSDQPPLELLARAALEDPTTRVRWLALQILDHYGEHRYDEVFVAALDDPVPRVRMHAAHGLACDACSTVPGAVDPVPRLLEVVRREPSEKVRRQAWYGLWARRSDERAATALAELAPRP